MSNVWKVDEFAMTFRRRFTDKQEIRQLTREPIKNIGTTSLPLNASRTEWTTFYRKKSRFLVNYESTLLRKKTHTHKQGCYSQERRGNVGGL